MSKITVIEFEQDDGGKAFINPASVAAIFESKSYVSKVGDEPATITVITMFSWQINVKMDINEVRRKIFGS